MLTLSENVIADLVRSRGYYYDKALGSYVSKWNGKQVSATYIKQHLTRYEAAVKAELLSKTDRLLAGKIDLASWQTQMAKEIRDAWRVNAILGKGGYENMTQADWGRLGGRLRAEYARLNKFAQDIKDGKLSDAQIRARITQYSQGPRVAFNDALQAAKKDAAYDLSRRYLGPAEHCEDCIAYAAMGWRPIGELPPPGIGSRCGHNCMCEEEFMKSFDPKKEF